MDPKELRGLMEAYSEVYAPQEVDEATAMAKRGLDEPAIRTKIAKSTGGGAAADRATALADKQVFRGSGSARDTLARKQRGDFRSTTSSNPGLQVGQHKATTPEDKAKQAARGAQRGVLTPAEKQRLNREEFDIFDIVLEFLQVEGYAETLEEAEWMMANIIDEEAVDIILGEAIDPKGAARMDAAKPKKKIDVFAYDKKVAAMKASKDAKMNKEEYMDEAQDATPPKGQSKYGRKAPAGYMQTRKPTLQQMSSREKQAFKDRGIGEEYMDEAQVANRDPDKYEREQQKKSAPVRGERTPMPPRGDKRREDFEKWYAANVHF